MYLNKLRLSENIEQPTVVEVESLDLLNIRGVQRELYLFDLREELRLLEVGGEQLI